MPGAKREEAVNTRFMYEQTHEAARPNPNPALLPAAGPGTQQLGFAGGKYTKTSITKITEIGWHMGSPTLRRSHVSLPGWLLRQNYFPPFRTTFQDSFLSDFPSKIITCHTSRRNYRDPPPQLLSGFQAPCQCPTVGSIWERRPMRPGQGLVDDMVLWVRACWFANQPFCTGGKGRPKKEAVQSRLAGNSVNKQENLHTRLVLGNCRTSGSPHPPARFFKSI